MWPMLDLILCNSPVALILTPDGGLELYPIKKTVGRYFWMEKYGIFQIEPRRFKNIRNGGNKSRMALYDARSGKPLDWEVMKDLEKFAKKNKLTHITQKDIDKAKLGSAGLQTKDEIVENLIEQKSLTMHEALDPSAELFLNDFKNYKPFELGAYVQRAIMMVKNHSLLKNTPMKPTFQIGMILGAVVIGIVILMAVPPLLTSFSSVHGSDVTGNLGGIFKLFATPAGQTHP